MIADFVQQRFGRKERGVLRKAEGNENINADRDDVMEMWRRMRDGRVT